MKREIREQVYAKCDGHCAYCGKEITYKQMQVDHVDCQAFFQARQLDKSEKYDVRNLLPACARCNRWKTVWSLEAFRREVTLQIQRLHDYSANYRLALDYGLISETGKPVRFYFEALGD